MKPSLNYIRNLDEYYQASDYTGIFSQNPDWPPIWVIVLGVIVISAVLFYSGYRTGRTQKDIEEMEKRMENEDKGGGKNDVDKEKS